MSTYYVDPGNYRASDRNSGKVMAYPLATLTQANALSVSGDTVLVRKGLYREQVTLPADGITWRALEPGAVVRGTTTFTGAWTNAGGGVYTKSLPGIVNPFVASAGRQLVVPSLTGTVTPGTFTYNTTTGLFSINLDGATAPTTVEIAQRSCFVLTNLQECHVEGFEVLGSNTYAIRLNGGGGHEVRHNKTGYSAAGGVRIDPLSPQLFNPTDAGAGSLAAGTYSYIVSAVFGAVESLPSSFNDVVLASSSRAVGLQWSNVSGATGYRVYGRTRTTETLLFSGVLADFPLVTGLPTWTDTGALMPGSTTPPLRPGVDVLPSLVEANEVYHNNSHGVYLFAASGCVVRGNVCHHNGVHGVGLLNGSDHNVVELNTSYANARVTSRFACGVGCDFFGVGTVGSSSNLIQRNLCYDNEDSGVSAFNGSDDCVIRRNVCYRNGDHGVDNFNAVRCHMINNTCVDNVTAGLNAEGGGTGGGVPALGIRMYNNVSVDNGVQSPRTSGNYRIDEFAAPDSALDNNLSYLTVPAGDQTIGANYEFQYDGHSYDTFLQLRAEYPAVMAHGVSADPLLRERSSDDYRLTPGSPGRGIATAAAVDYTPDSFEGADGGLAAGAYA